MAKRKPARRSMAAAMRMGENSAADKRLDKSKPLKEGSKAEEARDRKLAAPFLKKKK